MEKKKICIIGQLPPPIHGLSAALQTIIKSEYMNEKYSLQCIDIKDNKKILNHMQAIHKVEADLYYFTISQSILGNLRDMIILREILSKNKRVIIHYHGGYYAQLYKEMNALQKRINKNLISKIDIMIALSEGLKGLFKDVITSDKVRVCENYVDDGSIISDNEFLLKMKKIEGKSKIEVLYLSNFIKTKGYKDVLMSANDLKNDNLIFNFAGAFFNEEDKKDFHEFIEENNLQSNVKYHGVVKGKEKKELLANSDVFILPTYYPNEGQPISIIEAMGNGLAIVTTNHAGIPDIVKEENGYVVMPQSPEEISRSLKFLVQNRNKIIELGNNNRKVTLEKFREIHYINRLDNIFNEVFQK
ncbi:glycosyltransferase family 4 protein [Bacillus mycoides]|uniref:glycosyltransferase family 4 protein n=1 Tax=Bacillus mycoides TaxID=1405 RepID=UPI003D65E088